MHFIGQHKIYMGITEEQNLTQNFVKLACQLWNDATEGRTTTSWHFNKEGNSFTKGLSMCPNTYCACGHMYTDRIYFPYPM